MKKICSLDFLNKETFGVDVKSPSGEVLCSRDEEVTPNKLLKLYYVELCVDEELEAAYQVELEAQKIAESKIKWLAFDEEEAKAVQKYALIIADILRLPPERKNEVKQAAYYLKIANPQFKEEEALEPDFVFKRGEASFLHIFKELKLPKKVAEVAKLYFTKYDCNQFDIKKENVGFSLTSIVSIASYYNTFLRKTNSKNEAIMKMLRLGGNKFNIYILHKFIYKMRTTND